ncbi:DUF4097/DUF4098 family protein [Bacillus velezensis]|uniref:DUF4097 family beta strand repeat-containing protein n=1 Tax=Bacillus amyloliquefaciens group TaxID=1938374 RepID=UPI000FF8CD9D|nr:MULTISPECIES: DUF4097 family beta strand repeat-containing protein [Bacillus amyloliquefaciens group]MBL4959738.1 DUF4097 family beta strand repeat protein [Bacillus velezensis]MBU0445271.1 DUF4097 domain-containing protein [Bacillus amyloliquefaciens]MDH3074178.1 DUF4097 family beta strand repeat-containing protein [Bacillus velezensis]MDH3078271.1 DUF4097 family beta strand repeat-containing protein [Bacillus velezensis]MDH3098329.1 DUF4097 family beta strand repeat-containing protein [Ba
MKKIIASCAVLIVIGGIVLSLYKTDTKNFKKNVSYNVEKIDTLKVYTDSWDVKFKKSNLNKVTISAEGKQKDKAPVTFQENGRDLVVSQKEQKNGGFLDGFTFGKQGGTIYINVPDSGMNNIEITNKDGNIQLSEISAEHIVVDNHSGDEKINNVSAHTGKFSSKDGALSVENSSFEKLNITSASGDNEMKEIHSSNVKVTSKDGAVSIKDITEGKSLSVNTKSGDIGVSYKKAPTSLAVFAQSNSDVTFDLDGLNKSHDGVKLKKGEIGAGSNKVSLSSEDGSIKVR